ncbi:thioredoxin-like motif protein [Ranid herpesvirus 3]|uniref:Thioredoxin-like motif protein n=1 Tax=Ranid herpesvirus 3 TaxID=1987509 RepID=A0A1X9T5D8_9VIRU|nr:thioredoxin-like motif protein [Ranid herpesvirus 3]ARR28916.1 thioredoxin-like motif protein [Ranid herpesvirus 3]
MLEPSRFCERRYVSSSGTFCSLYQSRLSRREMQKRQLSDLISRQLQEIAKLDRQINDTGYGEEQKVDSHTPLNEHRVNSLYEQTVDRFRKNWRFFQTTGNQTVFLPYENDEVVIPDNTYLSGQRIKYQNGKLNLSFFHNPQKQYARKELATLQSHGLLTSFPNYFSTDVFEREVKKKIWQLQACLSAT